jgi:hypothetical protein
MNSSEHEERTAEFELMPRQSMPVIRRGASVQSAPSLQPSDLACDLCRLACQQLSGIAKDLCLLACSQTVCR